MAYVNGFSHSVANTLTLATVAEARVSVPSTVSTTNVNEILTVPKSGRRMFVMENFNADVSNTVVHSGLDMLKQHESPFELLSDIASISSDSGGWTDYSVET